MGPAFSKLIPKKNKESSTLDPLMPQFTVEDMEFEATVISTEPETKTDGSDVKTDVLPIQDSIATEPESLATVEHISESLQEPVIESILQSETLISEPVSEEHVEHVIEDKPGKKDKKEKRKKLRKESL